MARCGCAGTACSCVIQGGTGIVVDGAGTESNPYVINGGGAGSGGVLTVSDTNTVNLNLLGSGTQANPYALTANATLSLGELTNVNTNSAVAGNVLAWNGTTWQPIPPTTAPVGAIAVGDGLLGDGSAPDPLRLDPAALAGFVVPTGVVTTFAGPFAPDGWLLCNDTPVGRADYAALFALIGTTYGAGNGTTTFNVPNMVNRGTVGAGSGGFSLGTYLGNSTHTHNTLDHTHPIPSHTHSVPAHEHNLGTDGRAQIALLNDGVTMRRIDRDSWTANVRTNVNLDVISSTQVQTWGAPLDGTTNFAGPWTTGAGGNGNTGAGGAGTTGDASSYQPSLALRYIIKT